MIVGNFNNVSSPQYSWPQTSRNKSENAAVFILWENYVKETVEVRMYFLFVK